MNSSLEKLHDIEGLDTISLWPLALGWWILIGAGILIVFLIGWLIIRRLAFKRSWKYDAFQKLEVLEKLVSDPAASQSTLRATAITLSEYLRRIALRRYGRKECAGLVDEDWLKWLSRNDLKKFDWEKKGRLLIEAPYAPTIKGLSADQIKELIKATKDWVCDNPKKMKISPSNPSTLVQKQSNYPRSL